MSDLSKFITGYCMLWRNIGLKLGLQDAVLNVIEHEHPNQLRKCFRITLQKWLNQDVSATWETLELVITNANRDDLNLDNLTKISEIQQPNEQGDDKEQHHGTSSLVNVKENNTINMLIVGISGHGKSALSNFILQENAFQSGFGFIPVSKKAEKRTKIIQGINFSIVDTVGFSDGPGLQEHHLTQISNALEFFSDGINAIVFTIKSTERFTINISAILTDLQEMSDIWDHCFVVFTNIRAIASTESKQFCAIQQMLAHPSCPESLTSLIRMVNDRYMVVESVFPMGNDYYVLKISEIIKMITHLKPEPYTNRMFQVAFSKYKEAKEQAKISETRLLEQQHSLECRVKQLEGERDKQEKEAEERENQEKQRTREEQERQEANRLAREKHKKKKKHNHRQRMQLGRF